MNERISVLLVDDERPVAELAATHLERVHEGIDVEVQTAVETALSRFENEPSSVDCIVSDYTMPTMSGLDFLKAVRTHSANVPFILFTGKGSEEVADEAISAGVTDYLRKATGTDQYELLANRIDNAVEAYRTERRAAELERINGVVRDVQRELVGRQTREEIEAHVCQRLCESEPYTLAWVGEGDESGVVVPRARAGSVEYVEEIHVRTDDSPQGRGPAGTALRTGDVQVARNIPADDRFEPWREVAGRYGHESVIVLPLTHEGTSYGALVVYSNRRQAFGATERATLTELSRTIAQAIHAAETRARLERRERALAESERKYRSLLDAAPDAVFVADTDTGDIVETNAAAENLLGRPREEIIGMHQSELHPAGETERYRDLFEDGLAVGNPSVGTFEDGSPVLVERADGETVPVEISAGIVEVGGRTLVHGRFRDLTAQHARERELREERAVAESIFEATPDAIYAFDTAGRMLRWNEAFSRTVGYADEEIAEMNCLEFVPEDDRERIFGHIMEIVDEGTVVAIESAFVTREGEEIPHEMRGAPLTDGEGTVYGLIGSGRDITERNAREETVAALHEATRDLVRATDRTGVAATTADAAEEVLDFPFTVVRLHDPETDSLKPAAVTDATERLLGERPTYARGEGVSWRTFESDEPIVVEGAVGLDDEFPVRHRLYVPVGDHGTMSVAARADETFADTDIRLTQVLAANAAAALDRVEREEQLRRYERMLDAAGDMVYSLDADGRFTAVNEATVAMTGYPREALIGEHVSVVLNAEDVERGEALIGDLLSRDAFEEATDSFEITIESADGVAIPCEAHISLLRVDGRIGGTVGVVRDITERKRRETLLASLHDATRGMMAAKTPTDVAEVTVETVESVLEMPVNGVWLYDEQEAALQPVALSTTGRELFAEPPTYTGGESLAWTAFREGTTQRYERVDRESGVHNPETPIRSEVLLPLGKHGVLTIGSTEPAAFDDGDVSLSKLLAANAEAALNRAERERLLREHERQLVAERDRLTALFENTSDCVVETAFHGGEPLVKRVNPAFEETFGYGEETLVGNPLDEFIVPDGKESEAAGINRQIPAEVDTEVRRETTSGQRDFLFRAVPFEAESASTHTYGVYTDITDQKRRERELERQNELLDRFASVISHDLRSPMGVAKGRLALAQEECPTEHHADVEWALDRMNALIEDVLTLARQGKVIGDTERVSLSSIAETAWRSVGTDAASLVVEDPGAVDADPDRVLRLFENLLRNAIEHAGREATVAVGALDGGFYLADDGPGIPEDERESVFEHGYSTADANTGLGLTIVRSIADAHGWTIRVVESETGGARFEVRT